MKSGIFFTGVKGKEMKRRIAKNAKKRKYEYEIFKGTERIFRMTRPDIWQQLYAIARGKANNFKQVLIATDGVVFDVSPTQLKMPTEEFDVCFLNGDILQYKYPSPEENAEKQAILDQKYQEQMQAVWGEDWKKWVEWWSKFHQKYSEKESVSGADIKRHWREADVSDTDAIRRGFERTGMSFPEEAANDEWLKWYNQQMTKMLCAPVYREDPDEVWFRAVMKSSNAYIVNCSEENVSLIMKAGKQMFSKKGSKGNICDLFNSIEKMKTFVINASVCGKEGSVDTPESLPRFDPTSALADCKDDDLPSVSIVTPAHANHHAFFLTLMSFQGQNYPQHKIEWIIVDDSSEGQDVQGLLPADEKRIRYLKCSVRDGSRLSLGKKLNIGCKNAANDYIVFFFENMFYHPDSLKTRVLSLQKNGSQYEFSGCTNLGYYNTKYDCSFLVQQHDSKDHLTVFHQETVSFKKSFWIRRPFHEGLLSDNTQNLVCIPFTMERYSMVLDMPSEVVGTKIDTKKRNITDKCATSFRDEFTTIFREAIILLERETNEYSRDVVAGPGWVIK